MADPTPVDVVELAVNLDDVSPEVVADAQQKLFAAGALDVWATPIGMKKQRPGVCLSLLCEPEKRDELARRVLVLTGSFGVRFRPWGRLVLERRIETVSTRYGNVRVKVGSLDGRVLVARPEFESAKALADQHDEPVRDVLAAAQTEADRFRHPGDDRR